MKKPYECLRELGLELPRIALGASAFPFSVAVEIAAVAVVRTH